MKFFFSVGEPSGDLHGGNLIRQLRRLDPDSEFVGFGGPKMAAAGANLQFDLTTLAVMGLSRVLLNIRQFIALLWTADRYFRNQRPDAVVLIDYPGFNWWIARRAKKRGIPVYYYGTPQLWAWGGWRVGKLRRLVDHVLCKLPFEADWFRERNCPATYVGHPFFDELTEQNLDSLFVQSYADGRRLLTLLPGSRNQEVKHNLPTLLEAARLVAEKVPDLRVAIAAFHLRHADYARQAVQKLGLPIEVHVGRTPELIHAAHVCLACSGSVSLELLYHLKPTIIVYRVGRFVMMLQRQFRKVRFITLVNLLATERRFTHQGESYDPDGEDAEPIPFPEYLTRVDKSTSIARRLIDWLEHEEKRQVTVAQLSDIRAQWGTPGASRRAAEYLLRTLRAETNPRALRACA